MKIINIMDIQNVKDEKNNKMDIQNLKHTTILMDIQN